MDRIGRRALIIGIAALSAAAATAQEIAATDRPEVATDASALTVVERWEADPTTIFDGSEINLPELLFVARPVIVFADSPNDPNFVEQLALLEARIEDLAARDAIVIVDTDPAGRSPLRQQLRPRGFVMVLIGKDGRIAQRKPEPWDVREIGRAIDKLPLRQQEIREGH